jgi:hypothetical protein
MVDRVIRQQPQPQFLERSMFNSFVAPSRAYAMRDLHDRPAKYKITVRHADNPGGQAKDLPWSALGGRLLATANQQSAGDNALVS